MPQNAPGTILIETKAPKIAPTEIRAIFDDSWFTIDKSDKHKKATQCINNTIRNKLQMQFYQKILKRPFSQKFQYFHVLQVISIPPLYHLQLLLQPKLNQNYTSTTTSTAPISPCINSDLL